MTKTFTFNSLPTTLEGLKALPEANLQDAFGTVALAVAAFAAYPADSEACFEMINFLKGPEPISAYDKSFIKDRFSDKDYVPRSYFEGATPENDYKANEPFTITVSDNPYSYQNEGYATLYITSGGADNPRSVRVRQKASTGEWFLNEYGGILMSIREPKSQDPWA